MATGKSTWTISDVMTKVFITYLARSAIGQSHVARRGTWAHTPHKRKVAVWLRENIDR